MRQLEQMIKAYLEETHWKWRDTKNHTIKTLHVYEWPREDYDYSVTIAYDEDFGEKCGGIQECSDREEINNSDLLPWIWSRGMKYERQ